MDGQYPLRVGWLLTTCAAVALYGAADAFQFYDPAFPLDVALVVAVGLTAIAASLCVLLGQRTVAGFSAFMPFRGGTRFVTMQALGYTAVSAALISPTVYRRLTIASPGIAQHGPLAATGAIAGLGNWLLHGSLRVFIPSSPSTKKRVRNRLRERRTGCVMLACTLMATMLGTSVGAELLEELQNLGAAVTLWLHVASGALLHLYLGWKLTPGYRLFAPFHGRLRSRVARGAAWTLWSVSALFGVLIVASPRPFPRSYLLQGAAMTVSNFAVLAHILAGDPSKGPASPSAVASDGRFVLTVVASGCFVITAACATLLREYAAFRAGAETVGVVTAGFMFLWPPLSQVSARMYHGPSFDLWHPFNSRGAPFLAYQAVGWASFTIAAAVATVEFSTSTPLATAFLLLVSQVSIHTSVRQYDRKANQPQQSAAMAATRAREPGHQVQWTQLTVATALCLFSLVLRFACDAIPRRFPGFPVLPVMLSSTAMWAVSVFLAHIARSQRTKAVFRPFSGSAEYVALQAVGWSFFALCAILAIVQSVEVATMPESIQRRHQQYAFAFTVQGVLTLVPYGLIAASLFFDTPGSGAQQVDKLLRIVGGIDAAAIVELERRFGRDAASSIQKLQDAAREAPATPSKSMPSERGVAWIIVGCLAAACIGLAVVADASKVESQPLAVVLGLLCVATSLGTTVGVHCGYGPAVHGRAYEFWMPFRGGAAFVAWQACGGSCFAVGGLLFVFSLASLFEQTAVTVTAANVSGVAAAGVFCALTPIFFLVSIFHFDASKEPTAFEEHAEGIVSGLVFAFAWTLSVGTSMTQDMAQGTEDWALVAPPLVIGSLSMAVALPLGFIAIRKSIATWRREMASEVEMGEREAASTPDSVRALPILELASFTVLGAIPVLGLVAMHYAYNQMAAEIEALVPVGGYVVLCGAVLMIATSLVRSPLSALPNVVVDFIATALTFALYLALFTQSVLFYAAWVMPYSVRWVLAANTLLLMSPKPTRILTNLCNAGFAGYQLTRGAFGDEPALDTAINVTLTVVIMMYHHRYNMKLEVTGKQYRRDFVTWARRYWLWGMERYFSLRVLNDAEFPVLGHERHKGEQTVFGFHPHGMFPITAIWMQHLDEWIRKVGDLRRVTVHAASIVFSMPLVREIGLCFGSCVVTREAIEYSLDVGRSPLIVPGGQAEMIESYSGDKELTIVAYHKGFVRVAMRHGVSLTPVFAFGEHNIFDNVHYPKLQRYFLKRFGFGFPVLAIGRWGLPLPAKTRLTLCVGRPVQPASVCPELTTLKADTPEWEACVDKVCRKYFEDLRAMVYRHRREAGYPDLQLKILWKR